MNTFSAKARALKQRTRAAGCVILKKNKPESSQYLQTLREDHEVTVELKIGETFVEIDKGIAEVVKKLNEVGFRTIYSCSGLKEDHRGPHRIEGVTSVTVAGKCLELMKIAEASGWEWSLDGEFSQGKDSGPYVSFFSRQGCVYTVTKDNKYAGPMQPKLSTIEEALEKSVIFEFTSIHVEPEDDEPRRDRWIKRQIVSLLAAINCYAASREAGKDWPPKN